MKRVTQDLQLWLVEEYKTKSLNELREETGFSLSCIRNNLLRHGVQMRARGCNGALRWLSAEDERDRVVAMAKGGATLKEMSKATGRNPKTVWMWLKRRGVPGKRIGIRHRSWKGGRYVTQERYLRIRVDPDDPLMVAMGGKAKSVLEHRWVMAKTLRRLLECWETVHHIDGNRRNNDPKNLQLRIGPHGRGVCMMCVDCGSRNIRSVELGLGGEPSQRWS